MANENTIQPIKDVLTQAENVYVLISPKANTDTYAAALGLFHTLRQTKKNIFIASPEKISEDASKLPGAERVANEIGNRNLVISLKVDSKESIEKVSYNMDEEDGSFNLIIQPRDGAEPLTSEQVSYSYTGAQAELVFLVGTGKPEDMGDFYESERKLFSEATTVSLTRFPQKVGSSYNYADTTISSLSELGFRLLTDLGFQEFSQDAATALLAGIDQATQSLSHPTLKPDTFEAVAQLMRQGGRRQFASGESAPSPFAPPTFKPPFTAKGGGMQATQAPPASEGEAPGKGDVPEEWLTPKIYKGSKPKSS